MHNIHSIQYTFKMINVTLLNFMWSKNLRLRFQQVYYLTSVSNEYNLESNIEHFKHKYLSVLHILFTLISNTHPKGKNNNTAKV